MTFEAVSSVSGRLRTWQNQALTLWRQNNNRGIVGAVTGGGKTILALACIRDRSPETALIVVPTVALLDQWWEEAASFFSMELDEINVLSGRSKIRLGTINIGVLNSVAKLSSGQNFKDLMLVIDECHKAATPEFSSVLDIQNQATLGLSATPERPYDDGLADILVPRLGQVIFQYTYRDALRDGVIVPFFLKNVIFDLEDEIQSSYDKLTKSIARLISQFGSDAPETVAAYLKRARLLNSSPRRIEIALRLVARNKGKRILIFHEDIESCEVIQSVLEHHGVPSAIYHSKVPIKERARRLKAFRNGKCEVLVTCRALDEGFNVPETQVGIIAASTATRRQRIQRLGRTLRPSSAKEEATIYTIVATRPEIERLKQEESDLEGVAEVVWLKS